MTYPPPGGENPQYQLQPEPQQPGDPYMQGYNSTPPPPNPYSQQPPPPQYSQPQYSQPVMSPQVGVQPGYPPAPGSVLPPPIPPARQGGSLGVILGVIVVLVVVLGVAAVLIIPGMINDDNDDPQAGGDDDPATSEAATQEEEADPTEEATDSAPEDGAGFGSWGTPVSSEDFDPTTPEGVAVAYQVAQNNGDDETLQSLVSSEATDDMLWDLEYEMEDASEAYPYPYWGMSREADNGMMEAWAGWTIDDTAPTEADDTMSGYTYTLVQEDGAWKLYDIEYGLAD